LSTDEEIFEVFQDEINQKSKQVKQKFGDVVFYEGLRGMSVRNMFDLDDEDAELLGRLNVIEDEENTEEGDP